MEETEVKVVTLKPLTDEVEYGVRRVSDQAWLIHGIVIPFTLSAGTTGVDVIAAATEDAADRGLISSL